MMDCSLELESMIRPLLPAPFVPTKSATPALCEGKVLKSKSRDWRGLERSYVNSGYEPSQCAMGCLKAADLLQKAGFEVRALKPGYEELLKAGFPKAK